MEVWISFATVFLKFEKSLWVFFFGFFFFFFVVQIFFTPSIKAKILNQLAFRDYLHISSYATITSHTNQTISLFINSCFEQN